MSKWSSVILLTLLFVALPHLSFTPWPEMLSRPYLLLHGWLPYKDIVMEHAPAALLVLAAWYKIFGLGVIQLKLFTWLLLALSALLVYRAGNRLSVVLYLLLFFALDGNGLWFDHFLIPLALLMFAFFNRKKAFLYGLVLGLAFWFKQTALWFVFPPLILWFKSDSYKQNIFRLIIGTTVSLGLGVLFLWSVGILPDFMHWAVGINSPHLAGFGSGQLQLPTPDQLVYNLIPFVTIFIAYRSTVRSPAILHAFIIAGCLGMFPRWEQFHLLPALPFLALLVSDFYADRRLLVTKILFSCALLIFLFREYKLIWDQPDRFSEPGYFQTVQYVRLNTQNPDKIFVLNTWESLYALADRQPAARPLYPYLPWYLDLAGVQDKILSDLKVSPPALVIQGVAQETGLGAYVPPAIDSYLKQNYRQVVKIDSINVYKN